MRRVQTCLSDFCQYRAGLEHYLPRGKRTEKRRLTISPNQFSGWQVLVYQVPGSIPDLSTRGEYRFIVDIHIHGYMHVRQPMSGIMVRDRWSSMFPLVNSLQLVSWESFCLQRTHICVIIGYLLLPDSQRVTGVVDAGHQVNILEEDLNSADWWWS